MFRLLFLLLFAGCSAGLGQISNKVEIGKLFEEVKRSERKTSNCEQQSHAEQIRKFGKDFPKVSGHCWNGCPIRVVKPYYPKLARQLKINGDVQVETIVDEKGDVIYARVVRGPALFRRAALAAANKSKHQQKIDCDKMPIKFRWIISYRFHPSM